jgi:hypothetical protein
VNGPAARAPLPPRTRSGSQKRRRNRNIGIPVDPDEYAVIEAKAHASGLSIAGFGRFTMLGTPGPRARRSPPINAEALALATAAVNKVGSNLNQIARVLNSGHAAGTEEIRSAAAVATNALSAILALVGRGDRA